MAYIDPSRRNSSSQKTKLALRVLVCTALCLLVTACASQPEPNAYDPPGFFAGLWHGLTILIAMIGHLFNDSIRIYAFPNSGGLYDFGYIVGVFVGNPIIAAILYDA